MTTDNTGTKPGSLPRTIADVLDEASGRHRRPDPVVGRTGGPAGNARLTAWLGALLLVVLATEAITLLDVRGLLGWHVGLGVLLIALTLAKVGATGWRVVRYYTGSGPYRLAGPPPTVLRLLGPVVVVSALGVLGSGLALLALGPSSSRETLVRAAGQRIDAVTVHQVFFIAFAVAVGLHVLARLVPAFDRLGHADGPVPGAKLRGLVVTVALVCGAVAVVLVLPAATSW